MSDARDAIDAPSHAHVGFWNQREISPLVRVQGISREDLIMALWESCAAFKLGSSMGEQALIFSQNAEPWAVALVTTPVGRQLGETMARLQQPANAPQGFGILLVDREADQVEVYGGFGFELPRGECNVYQARRCSLSALWKPLEPGKRLAAAQDAEKTNERVRTTKAKLRR